MPNKKDRRAVARRRLRKLAEERTPSLALLPPTTVRGHYDAKRPSTPSLFAACLYGRLGIPAESWLDSKQIALLDTVAPST